MNIVVNNEHGGMTPALTMDVFAWDSRKAVGPDEVEVTLSADDLSFLGARARSYAEERRIDDPEYTEELKQRGVLFPEDDDVFLREPKQVFGYFESRYWRSEAVNNLLDRAGGPVAPGRPRFVIVAYLGGRLAADTVVLRFGGYYEPLDPPNDHEG